MTANFRRRRALRLTSGAMHAHTLFGLSFRTLRRCEPAPLLAQLERPEFARVLQAVGTPNAAAALGRLAESEGTGRSLTLVGTDRSGRLICLVGVRDYRGIEGALEPLLVLRPLREGADALREISQRLVWALATQVLERPLALSAARDDRPALEAMLALVGDVPVSIVDESWRGRQAVVCALGEPPERIAPLRPAEVAQLRRIVSGEQLSESAEGPAEGTSGGRRPGAPAPQRAPQRPPVAAAQSRRRAPAPTGTLMTPEGFERLRDELQRLTTEGRRKISARLKAAREGGSSADDAEWEAVREDQMELEARIGRIETELRSARVVRREELDEEVISVGVRVTLSGDDGRSFSYTLVGASEASPNEGRLSVESPLGAALLGRRAGEEVGVSTPRGPRRYAIASISLPDAA